MRLKSGLKGECEAPVIVLCGPTASGKTAAAIEIAQKIDAEIISADSGQVYRGMDIGTAKPTPAERRKIPFHLIDILDPDEQFSAADFRTRALEAIREIRKRGRRVIVAGGTGLYLKALEAGLFEGPSRDPKIREELEERVEREGVEALYRELKKVDPEAAKTIPPRNRQRLIRALEVYRLTGRPISEFWNEHRRRGAINRAPAFLKYGLIPSKDELHHRIDRRVDRMVEEGLVEEVRFLVERWGRGAPGLRIIGYKEVVAHLEDRIPLQEAVQLIKRNTRRYAKRQRTWFKKDEEIQWFSDPKGLIQHLTK
jgi:tRNA dimethylallyltransferase